MVTIKVMTLAVVVNDNVVVVSEWRETLWEYKLMCRCPSAIETLDTENYVADTDYSHTYHTLCDEEKRAGILKMSVSLILVSL